MPETAYTPAYRPEPIPCLVCGTSLSLRPAKGRKSNKPFLMFLCPQNARHFRAFVTDQDFVKDILDRVHGEQQ